MEKEFILLRKLSRRVISNHRRARSETKMEKMFPLTPLSAAKAEIFISKRKDDVSTKKTTKGERNHEEGCDVFL